MSAFVLRPPRDDERARLVDLWVEAWRATFPAIDFDARRDWLVAQLASLERDGAHLIAVYEDAAPQGFVTIHPGTGWLDQIAVRPERFGRGAARALLEEARRLSPLRIELDVNADNVRALRFYTRENFARIGDGRNPNSGLPTYRLRWTPRFART